MEATISELAYITTGACSLKKSDLNPRIDIDNEKIETLRKAVFAGTYAVDAGELAPKLIDYMLRLSIFCESSMKSEPSHLNPKPFPETVSQ